jgi:hypothetical protein
MSVFKVYSIWFNWINSYSIRWLKCGNVGKQNHPTNEFVCAHYTKCLIPHTKTLSILLQRCNIVLSLPSVKCETMDRVHYTLCVCLSLFRFICSGLNFFLLGLTPFFSIWKWDWTMNRMEANNKWEEIWTLHSRLFSFGIDCNELWSTQNRKMITKTRFQCMFHSNNSKEREMKWTKMFRLSFCLNWLIDWLSEWVSVAKNLFCFSIFCELQTQNNQIKHCFFHFHFHFLIFSFWFCGCWETKCQMCCVCHLSWVMIFEGFELVVRCNLRELCVLCFVFRKFQIKNESICWSENWESE